MTDHDPLCPILDPGEWRGVRHCECALIAKVRERIAGDIEAFFPDPHDEDEPCDDCRIIRDAARIARGES